MNDLIPIHVKKTDDDGWKVEANRLCAQWCWEHPEVADPKFSIIFDEADQ